MSPPLRQLLTAWGGVKLFVGLHYLLGAFVVLFLCIHIYLCTLGQTFWGGFTSMVSGWGEPRHEEEAAGDVRGRANDFV